jgi:putative sigma-54 modulation protein
MIMQIQIKATKIELTDAIRDYVQKKCDMLEKYLGGIPVINCHFEVGLAVGGQQSGEIFRAEINLDLNGKLLRVEKTEKDLYKAIDEVKDHMEREIVKFKEKMRGI